MAQAQSKLDHSPFKLYIPPEFKVPMMISAPHCGTLLTDEFKQAAAAEEILQVPDTDWFVHELYDFAKDLGIPLIHAQYSRYIIDLNRQLPGEDSLYANTSRVTGLVPLRTFDGRAIYKEGCEPDAQELQYRIDHIHTPYYSKIDEVLAQMQQKFPVVMLYDGHSIIGHVPSIQAEPFLDYMPANRSGLTCPNAFIEKAEEIIKKHGKSCVSNGPFQGGNITRSFHNADKQILSFQMEISQRIYMDESSGEKCEPNWSETVAILREIVESFSQMLLQMNEEFGA